MKAWQIQSFGIDQLVLADLPQPRPGRGEVLVKVHAASLNYRDLRMVLGLYNPRMPLPRIPCSDGAGEVVEVGEDVREVAKGQRVAGIFMQNWLDGDPTAEKTRGALGGDIDGMLAEYVGLRASGVVPIPDHLSYEEGATLPCAGVTAWNALENAAHVKPGEIVVTQGTGGVSVFALQFAKVAGARVIGTSSSDEKLERLARNRTLEQHHEILHKQLESKRNQLRQHAMALGTKDKQSLSAQQRLAISRQNMAEEELLLALPVAPACSIPLTCGNAPDLTIDAPEDSEQMRRPFSALQVLLKKR